MAKKTQGADAPESAEATAAAESVTESVTVAAEPAAPRPPQGITLRHMNTGERKRDFHPFFKHIPKVDPASLVVAGQDPFLAIPIPGTGKVAVKQVGAVDAAEMLTCDKASGGQTTYRLATDAEVAAFKVEAAQRAAAKK
jgi:hypothetical protein